MGKRKIKKKICVVTTSRADYGALRCLMRAIKNDKALTLQVIACGGHLLKEFGCTYKEIERDGYRVNKKVNMLLPKDDERSVIQSVGKGCYLFADVLQALKPDLLVILGDRFELISIATAALVYKIPLVHLSGGEVTEGAIDEAIRHAVTKMSVLHFPAAEAYRQRVIQMGENPKLVFNFGHLALDNVRQLKLLDRAALEKALNFKFYGPVAMVTYHPVTLEDKTAKQQVNNLMKAISAFDFQVIFTKANCDAGGREINRIIKKFCQRDKKKYKFFDNLGQLRYLSCLNNFDLMIGNSSSGMFEAPAFRLPVVNIGDRQRGRLRAKNIIDVDYAVKSIKRGIKKALSAKFKQQSKRAANPYEKKGVGNVAGRIKDKLKEVRLDGEVLKKKFYDINFKY